MYNIAEHSHTFADPLSGNPWRMVWVRGGPKLSQNDRNHIGRLVVLMHYKDQEAEDFKGDSSEGRVYTKGRISGFGSFYGKEFLAHLETESGTADICIILCDTKKAGGNAYLN